jgi:hypothetical protein
MIVPSLNSSSLNHNYDGFIYLSDLLIQFSATTDASANISSTNPILYYPIASTPFAVYVTPIVTGSSVPNVGVKKGTIASNSCTLQISSSTDTQLFWYSIGPAPTSPIYTNIINSGSITNMQCVTMDFSGINQYIASSNIYKNTNYGYGSWSLTSAPSQSWRDIACSSDGLYVGAVGYNGRMYISSNSGSTWTTPSGNSPISTFTSITCSSSGQYFYAVDNIIFYYSSSYGVTMTINYNAYIGGAIGSNVCVTTNSTGEYVFVAVQNGNIYKISNYGTATGIQTYAPVSNWYGITCNGSGQYIAAIVYGGGIYTSSDSGTTWLMVTGSSPRNYFSITSNYTGQCINVVVNNGKIYYSTDYGYTFNVVNNMPNKNYYSNSMNGYGNIVNAIVNSTSIGTQIYVSLNASN